MKAATIKVKQVTDDPRGPEGEGAAMGGAPWPAPRLLAIGQGRLYDGKFGMKRKETVTVTWWRAEAEETAYTGK